MSQLAGEEDAKRHFPQALEFFRRSYALADEDLRAHPDLRAQRGLAIAAAQVADQLTKTGERREAMGKYSESIRIFEQLAVGTNAQAQEELAAVLSKRSQLLLEMGDPKAALADAQQSFAIVRRLAAADSQNAQLQQGLAGSYGNIGVCLAALGRTQEGLALLSRSADEFSRLRKNNSTYPDLLYMLAQTKVSLADALYRAGRISEALRGYRKAFTHFENLSKIPGQDDSGADAAGARVKMGTALLRAHQYAQAEREYRTVIEQAQPLLREANSDASQAVARAWFGLGGGAAARGAASEACDYYARSVDNWKHASLTGFDVSGLSSDDAQHASLALRSCAKFADR